jgi:adenylate cyclase
MSQHKFRMDFVWVNASDDPELPEYVAVPHPARYEYFKDDKTEGYFDKLDPRKLFFDIRAVADLIVRASKMDLTKLSPMISDSKSYVASRSEAIREGITRGHVDPQLRDATDEEQQQDVARKTDFVVMSFDLVGSTKLSQALDGETYANVIATYSSEVAKMCYRFHGRPLKFMGDGALLYFPIGTFVRRHDMAMDCALSLRDLILEGFNPVLAAMGLPVLACRIGVDSGEAYIITVGDAATTNHVDIVGEVLNIATKIEKAAPKNGVCVGESIVINTHTIWLQHMTPIPPPDEWPYFKKGTPEPYPVYMLNIPVDEVS